MGSIFYVKFLNGKKSLGLIGLMLALTLILTFIFGGMFGGEGRQTLFVSNEDGTVYAQRLLDEIDRTKAYKIVQLSTDEMNRLLAENKAQFGLVIPEGFHEAISLRNDTQIKLIRTAENSDFFALQGVIRGILQSLNHTNNIVYEGANILRTHTDNTNIIEERLYNLVEEKWKGFIPISTSSRVYGEKSIFIDQKTQASLGFLLFFSMYPIIFIIGEILEDKRLLVWDRLIISPITKFKIYFSNLSFVFIIGMLQISLLLILNYIFFGLQFGQNIMGVLLIVSAFVFAVSAMGLLISSFVKTNQQLSSIAPVIIVSSSMLGGLFWPSEIISNSILRTISNLTPQFWAMEALKKVILYNLDIESILLNISILIMMGILFLGTAIQIKEFEN